MSILSNKDTLTGPAKNADHEMSEDLYNAVHHAGEKVRSMFDAANDDCSQARHYVQREIQANPMRSGLIMVGVGMVLGALLRR